MAQSLLPHRVWSWESGRSNPSNMGRPFIALTNRIRSRCGPSLAGKLFLSLGSQCYVKSTTVWDHPAVRSESDGLKCRCCNPQNHECAPETSSLGKPSDDCIPATAWETLSAKHPTQPRASVTVTDSWFLMEQQRTRTRCLGKVSTIPLLCLCNSRHKKKKFTNASRNIWNKIKEL